MTLNISCVPRHFSCPSIFVLWEVTSSISDNLTHFYYEGMCLSKKHSQPSIFSTQWATHTLSSGFLEVLCVISEAIAFNRPSLLVEYFTHYHSPVHASHSGTIPDFALDNCICDIYSSHPLQFNKRFKIFLNMVFTINKVNTYRQVFNIMKLTSSTKTE